MANLLAFIGFSLPTFVTGLLSILLFGIVWIGCLLFSARTSPQPGWHGYWEQFKQAAMPVAVLALLQAASWTRYVRSSVLK